MYVHLSLSAKKRLQRQTPCNKTQNIATESTTADDIADKGAEGLHIYNSTMKRVGDRFSSKRRNDILDHLSNWIIGRMKK